MFKPVLERLRKADSSEVEGEAAAEAGFTLIELMVVLLIMGILLAIAIPTFLGVTNSANDRGAQSNLTNAVTEAIAVYQAQTAFTGSTATPFSAVMSSSAPEFSWISGAGGAGACTSTSASNCISVDNGAAAAAGDGQALILATLSKTGVCWAALIFEQTPVSGSQLGSVSAQSSVSSGVTASLSNAGTYYSKSAVSSFVCNATTIATTAAATWGPSYSNPGIL